MLSGIFKTGKRIGAAVLLLLLAVVFLEVWLQVTEPPPVTTICPQVPRSAQPLLLPAGAVHHELRRMTTLPLPGGHQLQTNSLGLRGSEPGPSTDQALRIVVLGDETVLGLRHPEQQTLPAVLRKFLEKSTGRNVSVFNAGVPGYSPLLSSIRFRQQLVSLQPDLVLLHFDMNDVSDDSYYRRLLKTTDTAQVCDNPLLQGPSQSSLSRVIQQSALLRSLQSSLTHSQRSDDPRSLASRYRWTIPGGPDLRLPIQHALRPLAVLSEFCRQKDLPLLVCTSPVPWQVADKKAFPQLARQFQTTDRWPVKDDLPGRVLKAACQRHGILFCDARTAFADFAATEQLYLSDTVFLSELGNSLYAREIASKILSTPQVAQLFRRTATARSQTQVEH